MSDNGIPKLYYSISEVAEMIEVEPHVLRYWETEFRDLSPKKNRAGRRIYRKSDIGMVKHIKYLLKDRKFTIEGARQVLENGEAETASISKQELLEIRSFLQQVLDAL